jgi:hypothetical protein
VPGAIPGARTGPADRGTVAAFGPLVTHAAGCHDGLRVSLLPAALLVLLATTANLLLVPAAQRLHPAGHVARRRSCPRP